MKEIKCYKSTHYISPVRKAVNKVSASAMIQADRKLLLNLRFLEDLSELGGIVRILPCVLT